MSKIPLSDGFYVAQSIIAGAQRCLNLYPEANAPDSPFPFTHYRTPGLILKAPSLNAPTRGQYTASDGTLWEVIGNGVYWTDSAFNRTFVGNISSAAGPTEMADNRLVIVLVDGSANGWWINMATKVMTKIVDAAFYGSVTVRYLDTFFLFVKPRSNLWYISPSEWDGVIAFDALDFAALTGGANGIANLEVVNRQIWLIGDRDYGEIWYNLGTPDFTFGRVPGVAIQHGSPAPHSLRAWDLMVYWLGWDDAGQLQFFQGTNYQAQVISPPAICNAISAYGDVTDCVGFVYQQRGHVFVVWSFPSADKTWAYDITEKKWHERAWCDSDGTEHRIRANCHAFAYGKAVVGDWETGATYEMTPLALNDNGQPIGRRRGFPHIVNNSDKISVKNVVADMAVGQSQGTTTSNPPMMSLGVSITKGASWLNPMSSSAGSTGQYLTNIQFNQIGMGRDWVFEVFWDFEADTALNGLWVDAVTLPT